MCLNPVGDPNNNFFIEPTGIATNVDVLILIRFKYCYKLVIRIHFIFATFSPFIYDLKIKQFTGSGYSYLKFSISRTFIVLIKTPWYQICYTPTSKKLKIMADDKTKTGSPDSDLINTSENYEVEYWSKKFGVSAEELKAAVKAVGNSAKAVEAHLKK